jgi:putative transposase
MAAARENLCVARSNMAEGVKQRPSKARGRPQRPMNNLVDEIKAIISEMPTYGIVG